MISPLRAALPSRFVAASRKYSTPAAAALERIKLTAGVVAVVQCLRPEDRVIGIGSGSTVVGVVKAFEKDLEVHEGRWFVPTGWQSRQLIRAAGLRLGDVDQFDSIDLTFDGADDIDDQLNAIKGGGACHLQEKVVAELSKRFVLVADWRKQSSVLGSGHWKQGIPIEVVPTAAAHVLRRIERIRGFQSSALRMGGSAKAGPVVSDNGNFVVDACFDSDRMSNPGRLMQALKLVTGVVEVGLFVGMADEVFFAMEDMTIVHKRKLQ